MNFQHHKPNLRIIYIASYSFPVMYLAIFMVGYRKLEAGKRLSSQVWYTNVPQGIAISMYAYKVGHADAIEDHTLRIVNSSLPIYQVSSEHLK